MRIRRRRSYQIVIAKGGERELINYEDVDTNSSIFQTIGEDFERQSAIRRAQIGAAQCRLFRLRDAVDFASGWLAEMRR